MPVCANRLETNPDATTCAQAFPDGKCVCSVLYKAELDAVAERAARVETRVARIPDSARLEESA